RLPDTDTGPVPVRGGSTPRRRRVRGAGAQRGAGDPARPRPRLTCCPTARAGGEWGTVLRRANDDGHPPDDVPGGRRDAAGHTAARGPVRLRGCPTGGP